MIAFTAALRAAWNGRWSEMRDVAEAQVALARAQAMQWRRPLGELVDVVSGDGSDVTSTSASEREMCERLVRAVTLATRYGFFRPHCLTRAVALSRILDAHGIRGHKIRIGVRRQAGAFIAHAWVEMGSAILGEARGTDGYVRLADMRVVPDNLRLKIERRSQPSQSARMIVWDQ